MLSFYKLVLWFTLIHCTAFAVKHTTQLPCSGCNQLLQECHQILKDWFINEQEHDNTLHIMTAYRCQKEQNRVFRSGASKAQWSKSAHNYMPSFAIDLFFLVDGKSTQNAAKYKAMIKRLPPAIANGSTFNGLVDWSHFYVKNWEDYTS